MENDERMKIPERISRLQVEVTTWCNLRCRNCPRTCKLQEGKWDSRNMELSMFETIIAHSLPGDCLHLSGIGEPTTHPGLIEMIRHARGTGKFDSIVMNTNGLVRDVRHYKELHAAGVNEFYLSVDSLNQEIADLVRTNTDTGRLRETVRGFCEALPFVVCTVVTRTNLDDLPATLGELDSIGSIRVVFQPVEDPYEILQDGEKRMADDVLEEGDREKFMALLSSGKDRFSNLDMTTYARSLQASDSGAGDSARCMMPLREPYVTVDGYLTPCCWRPYPDIFGHASLAEEFLEECWNNRTVAQWLKAFGSVLPKMCRGCVNA